MEISRCTVLAFVQFFQMLSPQVLLPYSPFLPISWHRRHGNVALVFMCQYFMVKSRSHFSHIRFTR